MDRWYVVCESRQAGVRPLAREVLGRPLVVWRDREGRASLLEDRCPHRNVPLALGEVTRAGLRCAYHGWTFAADGRCLDVPGLPGQAGASGRAAAALPLAEQDGWLWGFFGPGAQPAAPPPRPPAAREAFDGVVRDQLLFQAPIAEVAENLLDVPHTRFLHGGLFRSPHRERDVEVVVRRGGDAVEAEYLGEPPPAGLLGRLLAPRQSRLEHRDRFRLPALAEVEYRLGARSVLVAASFLTPETAERTRLYASVAWRLPFPAPLVRLLVEPLLRRVARQDQALLARQSECIRQGGGARFASTDLDVLGAHIRDLLRALETGETPSALPREHRRRMRI